MIESLTFFLQWKTNVTLTRAYMMACVWKLTTNWASCATAQLDTVDLIVKVR